MDVENLTKLADLFGQDLAGWKVMEVHFLELAHGLAGTFPAINGADEPIVAIEKAALKMVWDRLRPRSAKVTSFLALVHPERGIGFSLETGYKGDTKPLHVYTTDAIRALCEKDGTVRWASGLYGGSTYVSLPDFR